VSKAKIFLERKQTIEILIRFFFRAYPNNWVVMRPSEKFEAKAAGEPRQKWFSPR